jgi:hypothetical protein
MPKYRVMVARVVGDGWHRQEVTQFVSEAIRVCTADSRIDDVIDCPIGRTPTPAARNILVAECRKHAIDFLFQIDDDMRPPAGFFKAALDFLIAHDGPAVIGSPYCTAPPREDVCVFEWATGRSHTPSAAFAVVNVVREDAAKRKGIETCANIGTGCIGYSVSAFDRITHPYYQYSYADETCTLVTETEDCWNARKLYFAGVPLYVHWDFWSEHRKEVWVGKPVPLEKKDIDAMYLRHAREVVLQEMREAQEKEAPAPTPAKDEPAAARERYLDALRSPAPGTWTTTLLRSLPPQINPGVRPIDAEEFTRLRNELNAMLAEKGEAGKLLVLPGLTYAPDKDAFKALIREVLAEDLAPTPGDYATLAMHVGPRPSLLPQMRPFSVGDASVWAGSVEGWMHPDELAWLAAHAQRMPTGGAWLEVGSWKGRSLAAVTLAAPAAAIITAVDTWAGSPAERDGAHKEAAAGNTVWDQFLATRDELRALRPDVAIWTYRDDSVAVARSCRDAFFGVVFLDGDHTEAAVRADIEAWWPKVKPGGLLCGHDRYEPGVAYALAWAFGDGPLKLEEGPGSIWFVRMPAAGKPHPCRERDEERAADACGFAFAGADGRNGEAA